MQLADIENLLNIKIKEDEQEHYKARLDAAINFAESYCRTDFKDDDGVATYPGGVKMGIATIVREMGESQNVQSQRLGDMSKSFFQNGSFDTAKIYLQPFRKNRVGFV